MFIRRAFELFATGEYSIRKLCEKLYLDGYYYQQNKPQITKTVLEGMLKNVIYTGQMRCNGIVYQGKHPAIVSFDLFNKAQQAFQKVSKSKVRKNFHFLYPGIAKCEVCGYAISGERKKYEKVYYRCTHNDPSCTNTLCISEKEMTASFHRHLLRIALDEKLYELVKTSLAESLKDEQNYHRNEVKRLNKEIECTETLKKMYLDQLNKVIDMDLWITFKNEYEFKLNRLNAEL